ncbi:serine protease [uncultured Aliivibrio sp.]|uniref:S1 family peptidase n=1 Tax=uncultured Aliivibrio sp. TaxID=873085 RepID=UPI00261094E2|nr:serine protease [uncultured Aliivibrio sp.]
MNHSILKIHNTINDKFGTGFVIGKDSNGVFILTCGHVINGVEEQLLVDGKAAKTIQNNYSSGLDLAVVYVENLDLKVFTFSNPIENTGYSVIGFTKLGKDIKKEEINHIRIKKDIEIEKFDHNIKINHIKIHTNDEISSGYSGSPLICMNTNTVIGIVNIKNGPSVNYAISNIHINEVFSIDINEIETPLKHSVQSQLSSEESYYISKELENSFNSSLSCYSKQNKTWIEPKLFSNEELPTISPCRGTMTEVKDIISSPSSMVIQSRQQFGLTSLAKYLVKKAWEYKDRSFWLYLDVNDINRHKKSTEKYINRQLASLKLTKSDVECVIIDEVSLNILDIDKIIKVINDIFIDKSIILMLSKADNPIEHGSIDFNKIRHFKENHLWSLTQNDIRQIVQAYNSNNKFIASDDIVINRLTKDLEVLNIPRTPLNCLTFLKIYEFEFDESPVNRTEMIKRVLFLLFNVDNIPKYKTRPDLKDVEYILGYFCENIIRTHEYNFSRDTFLNDMSLFCKDSEIDLDINVIFDILYSNNIIIQRNNMFCFKFTYWVFYFSAHRMLHNEDFCKFILNNLNYITYPEIIEYYTGIDRNRENALRVLISDLKKTKSIVNDKCNLPDNFNIYNLMHWTPSEKSLEHVQQVLTSGAMGSKLPDEIKDSYADQSYNHARPLSQNVNKILEEYSLLRLMKCMQSSSKALRNSDYATPKLRHELLTEILNSWVLLINVLIIFAPSMSQSKRIMVDGACFALGDDFTGTVKEIFGRLLPEIPSNVVSWFQDDIFSQKMGSLLYKNALKHDDDLIIHTLALLIIRKRPNNWEEHISQYIDKLNKNSYYLLSIFEELNEQYQYSFTSTENLENMAILIKKSMAKHKGIKSVGKKILAKISDSILPDRIE